MFIIISLLMLSANAFDCNYIDMGWNVVHPINQCVIGRNTPSHGMMSMAHTCIDKFTVESKMFATNDCSGDFEIVATHDCNSNTTFTKCDCSFNKEATCSLVTDIQYVKQKNGECDKTKFTDKRTYLVHPTEIPKSFIDSNCFERQSDNKDGKNSISKTVPFWLHKITGTHL
eukprot:119419_1